MVAKNKYSRIHYNATSSLIVMLSAHEIKFYPLNSQWTKDTCKNCPCFTLFWAIFLSCLSGVACPGLALLVDKESQPLSHTV